MRLKRESKGKHKGSQKGRRKQRQTLTKEKVERLTQLLREYLGTTP